MGEKKRKFAAEATNAENLPGKPEMLQTKIGLAMPSILELIETLVPGCGIALFVSEPAVGDIPGRFNYVSNSDRADMMAMLAAFVAKNKDLINKQSLDEALAAIKPEGGTQ